MKYIELNNKMANDFKETFDFEALLIDKQAVVEYEKEINKITVKFDSKEERLNWLITNNYYNDFTEYYTMKDLVALYNYAWSFPFEYMSFMSISKFYEEYALLTNDGLNVLEHFQDRVATVAVHLAQGNIEKAKGNIQDMMLQNLQYATPVFKNAGLARAGELISCFLLEMDDSLNSIAYNHNASMQLSKIGGGVSTNLTKLRSRLDPIKEKENRSSGVVPVMKIWEDLFSYVDQEGARQGAGAVYYHINGLDIEEFLGTKKENADEKSRIQSLSIGVVITDKFMEQAWKGEDYYVFSPYSIKKEFGVYLDEVNMSEWYDKFVANPKVRKKKLNARKMLDLIAKIQLESGYPYILYIDTANKAHALKDVGMITKSNLCTEILQISEVSKITDPNDYYRTNEYNRDISCVLASANIERVMATKRIKEMSYTAIDGLTDISRLSNLVQVPSIAKGNREMRSVGMGAMNLAGYLAKNGIGYEDEEAKDFVNVYFMMTNFYTLEKSMLIAKETGETFRDYHKSEYAKGTYFDKYIEKDFLPVSDKVKQLFDGIYVPTKEDWKRLKQQVLKHGVYNSYRQAIAPTGSISYLSNSTPSLFPIPSHIETRTQGKTTKYYPMPYLSPETYFVYKDAYEIDMYKLIDLVAVAQEHVDQAISTILYATSQTPSNELVKWYAYAWAKGLKTLYYTRTKTLKVEECSTCQV